MPALQLGRSRNLKEGIRIQGKQDFICPHFLERAYECRKNRILYARSSLGRAYENEESKILYARASIRQGSGTEARAYKTEKIDFFPPDPQIPAIIIRFLQICS